MKKWMAGLLSAVVVCSAGSVAARGYGCGGQCTVSGFCAYHPNSVCRYADENGDGVCDHYGTGVCGGAAGYGMRGLRQGRGYCGRS